MATTTELFANRNRLHKPIRHMQLTMLFAIVLQLFLP
jgi:hypothetical protein